jgi:hypothetical protein
MNNLKNMLHGTPWVTLTAVVPDGNPVQVNVDVAAFMLTLRDGEKHFTRIMLPAVAAVALPSMQPKSPPMVPHSIYGYVDVKETAEEIFAMRYPVSQ